MSFPACRHRPSPKAAPSALRHLASEPFRLFFISGAVWSIIGVSLWPLFYAGKLTFFPNYCHARLMIEAFGGAFVIGFLGTAGPRLASAPKLTPLELLGLFALHQAGAICHLRLQHAWGDALFAALLTALLVSLVTRVLRYRQEMPPPQMLLALTGLLCGSAGALLHLLPSTWADLSRLRLAGLLLDQGLLLPPVLGIGSFLFPRMLGRDFGDPASPLASRRKRLRAITAALLLVGSFFVEAFGSPIIGCTVRALTAAAYLLAEVNWRKAPGSPPRGSLAAGLRWSLITGLFGILLAGLFVPQHIAIEHLLYIGGFGLLILIVASRVLFGHSGDLAGFEKRGWFPRLLIFLGILTALTRMSPAFVPQVMISHHIYAAWTWALLALLWLVWHRRRFFTREAE
ncbi:MAG: NnrS family protein [Prosthecobacter sp.]|nr:NnrS family protein [Prosthecobacter sp.]